MKTRLPILLIIILGSLIILGSTPHVSAQPMPIGDTIQLYPFESQPTTHAYNRSVSYAAKAYDGDVTSKTGRIDFTTGHINYTSWERPSDYGREDFEIGWVDFKMRYTSQGSIDDEYRIVYYVYDEGPVVLKDWIGGTDTLAPIDMGAETLAQTWANATEPNDGVWTWNDIGNITFVFETKEVNGKDSPFAYYSFIYEIWISVYPAGAAVLEEEPFTAVSVFPSAPYLDEIATWEYLMIDVYVTNVTALMGWEFKLFWDPTIIVGAWAEGWTYWPHTHKAKLDYFDDHIHMSFVIPTGTPITPTGWNGTYPIARVYLPIQAEGTSWLQFKVSKMGDPEAIHIPHIDFHGFYGTPVNKFAMGVPQEYSTPDNEFPWTNPIDTLWLESVNVTGRTWQLLNWSDVDGSGNLSATDLINMTDIETGDFWAFQVEEIWQTWHTVDIYQVSMKVKFIEELPPIPEFPLGPMLILAIAPAILITYLWKIRKKGWVKR